MKRISTLKHNLMRATLTLALIVTCAAAWAETVETYYIDANGTRHDVTATVLTGTGNLTADQWYVVNSDVNIENSNEQIYCYGNLNLILADGKTFTISSSHTNGIICSSDYGTLNIYGQENGTGTLNVTATGSSGNAIYGDSGVNIVGCKVTAISTGANGIFTHGNITISGGQVSATGNSNYYGINTGYLTLGWRKTTDHVYASSYYGYGTVKVKDGLAFKDDSGNIYVGTLNSSQISAIAGKTLTPVTATHFSETNTNEYTIYTATGWGLFCDALLDNDTYNRFSGKNVKLDADIEVSRMAGSQYHDFAGTFDGYGKTLTFNYSTTNSTDRVAPFSYITNNAPVGSTTLSPAVIRNLNVVANITTNGQYAGGIVGEAWGELTIEDCTVSGTITTSNQYAGGIIGRVSSTPLNITDCRSSVTISSSVSGDGIHGGIAARVAGTTTVALNISGCLFNGKIVTTNGTTHCGGFVGHNDHSNGANVSISNSLYAPTADANTVSTGCATFVRDAATITNCYYTATLGTEQGKERHSITAGQNVTSVANAGTATPYNTSGITSYGTGIKYNNVLYAGENDQVSLTLNHSEAPTGSTFIDYTVRPEGTTLNGTGNSYTLNMPNANVTIDAMFTVTYLNEYGEEVVCYDYTLLTGNETTLGSEEQPTWYVVDGTINFNQTINVNGYVHIILKDEAVMNVGTESDPVEGSGIHVTEGSISIYGQSTGADKGQLNIYAVDGISTNYGSVTINGGQVTASGDVFGIYAFGGSVTINGGQVTATGNVSGIYAQENNSNITLGWTTPADYIYANKYNADGTLTLTKTFIDEDGNTYSGTIEQVNEAYSIDGKTLYPAIPGAVFYLDMNGQRRLCAEYTTLTNDMTNLGTADMEKWYVADGTIDFTSEITVEGDVHLILKDGAVMNVGTESNPINGDGIKANGNSLSIYAQSTGASKGQLHVYVGGTYYKGFNASNNGSVTINGGQVTATGNNGIYTYNNGSVTINGGQVTATSHNNNVSIYANRGPVTINGGQVTATGKSGIYAFNSSVTINGGAVTAMGNTTYGIYTFKGSVNISGGQVTATGGTYGIYAGADNSASSSVTLGWTNATDFIYANSYGITTSTNGSNSGSISIASGKTFVTEDDATYQSGPLNEHFEALAGKTLYPQGVIFKEVAGYGEGTGGWVFIASPVAGSISPTDVHNLLGSYDETTGKYDYDLYRFNQSADLEWQNYHSHTDDFNLENGHGYLYATRETKKLAFGGTFNTDNSKEVTLQQGWNLVGNPFTVNATINRNYYTMNADGTGIVAEEVSSTIPIAPFTGVIVQATTEKQSVTFTKASQQSPVPSQGSLNIALTQANTRGNALLDNAIVSFNEGSHLSKFYFGEQNGNIYIPQNGEEYAIVSAGNVGEMPVNFKAHENGTYTLTVSSTLNSKLSTLNYLHLIDNMTGADVDLLTPPVCDHPLTEGDVPLCEGGRRDYTFTAKTTDYESRFRLVFVCGDTNDDNDGDNDSFAFYTNGSWIIANEGQATLQVIDVNGRILSSETVNGSVSKSIHAAAGVYMLRLINGEDVKVQKVVIE